MSEGPASVGKGAACVRHSVERLGGGSREMEQQVIQGSQSGCPARELGVELLTQDTKLEIEWSKDDP